MFPLSGPLSSQAASLLSSRTSAASLGISPLRPLGFGRDDKLDQIRAPAEMTRRVAPPNALFTNKLPPPKTPGRAIASFSCIKVIKSPYFLQIRQSGA